MRPIEQVTVAWDANVPVVVLGDPGTGKTEIVNQLALASGYYPVNVNCAQMSDAEWSGYKMPGDKGVLDTQFEKWKDKVCQPPPAGFRGQVVIADEYTRWNSPASRNAALTVFQSRLFSDGSRLHPETRLCGLGNPATNDSDAQDLPAALANRSSFIEGWSLAYEEWTSFLMGGPGALAGVPNLDLKKLPPRVLPDGWAVPASMVADFLKRESSSWAPPCPSDPTQAGKAWPSPRSWYNAVAMLASLSRRGLLNDVDARLQMVAACVGSAPAVKLSAYWESADLPDPDAILANPSGIPLPRRPDQMLVTARAVGASVKTAEQAAASLRYIVRIRDAGWSDIAGRVINDNGSSIVQLIFKAGLHKDKETAALLRMVGELTSATFLNLEVK